MALRGTPKYAQRSGIRSVGRENGEEGARRVGFGGRGDELGSFPDDGRGSCHVVLACELRRKRERRSRPCERTAAPVVVPKAFVRQGTLEQSLELSTISLPPSCFLCSARALVLRCL